MTAQVTTVWPARRQRTRARVIDPTLSERVRLMALGLGCRGAWARAAGLHVILGMGPDEAFARITPLGNHAYGLCFRSPGAGNGERALATGAHRWAPLLLIDGLAEVVEHALVGEGALPRRVSGM